MMVICPQCQSPHIETLDRARTLGCAVGSLAGAAGLVSTVVGTAGQTGYQLGTLPGLLNNVVGITALPSGALVLNSDNAVINAVAP